MYINKRVDPEKAKTITYNLHKLVFLLDKKADNLLNEKIKITFSQFKILMAINHRTVSQKEIAQYWDMTEAAVSRQVELLLAKKLISIAIDEKNRRRNALMLTKEGERLFKEGRQKIDSTFEEIYSQLNKSEQEVLTDGLDKLLKSVCSGHEEDLSS